jgi:hypothetical protein
MLAAARDLLSEALRLQPTSAEAWYRLGRVAGAQVGGAERESGQERGWGADGAERVIRRSVWDRGGGRAAWCERRVPCVAAQGYRAEAEGLLLTAVRLAASAPALAFEELPLTA